MVKRLKGRKTISHKETLVLAKGSFSLLEGKSARISLRLTAIGKNRLAHVKHHPLAAKLILTVKGGSTLAKSVLVS